MIPLPRPRAKIVVLDDSQIALDQARGMLQEGGYEVVTTNSAIGFSMLLKREKPDLVLVDVTMPALRGDKLIEIVKRHQSSPPVGGVPKKGCMMVLHSDRPVEELDALARSCGAGGYISKTGDTDIFLKAVKSFLALADIGATT